MRSDLPSGTVTFLFTDVEGSTKLLHELGAEAYDDALIKHRRLLREAFTRHGGVEVDTQGDAFFYAFPTAEGAVRAAGEGQDALSAGPISVRMGLHAGTPHIGKEGYIGDDVHLGARIAATAHGGQVILSASTADLVELDLTDLGEHRLKDIPYAVPIFQLGSASFPPLKTISNTNLPRPASSFVGRERETAEVISLLRDGARLVTLSGPGGSGKTRLAIEAASELVPEFKAGVFWVGLASLRDTSLVMETISQTLGAKDGLEEHIGERELLLLLDNLEQVVDCAPSLATLVEACPNLSLLVTSRELLRVRGEVEYAVPPLAEPDAVDLFCARAHLKADDTIAELCRRLDSLPLAVELAAARTRVLSPAQILERISQRLDLLEGGRDAEARQQTLRATIEWSYELLTKEEQQLLRRLSVFAGGCTLEVAEEVAEADLDTLQSLVDKSLLRFTDGRYWMLETIREYALEKLVGSGEAAEFRRRHAEWFLALAEEAGEQDLRWAPGDWLVRLDQEHDNLRAAIDRLESRLTLRLVAALWRFWQMRGYREEGRGRLETALRADERPSAARAKALAGAAVMAVESGDPATARRRAEDALALHRSLGDRWGAAFSLFMLGAAAANAGDIDRACQHYEESVRAFRELGDENYTLLATRFLAAMYENRGDRERAFALHEETLLRARAAGNREMEEEMLGTLGKIAIEQGRVGDALPMLREALRIAQTLGNPVEIAVTLRRFAFAFATTGKSATAVQLVSASEALSEQIGFAPSWFDEMGKEVLDRIRLQPDEAAFADAWEEGQKLTVEESIELALRSID